MDIRTKTCIIIRKHGEFLQGTILGTPALKWSVSPYDAWSTRDREKARRIALKVGGVTVLFNPIVKQMRVM